jgi:predicted transcriptional regulator
VPCIGADGTLTESAKTLLKLLEQPATPEEIAARLGHPLFLVRASLRELLAADLLRTAGGQYSISEQGRKKLQSA